MGTEFLKDEEVFGKNPQIIEVSTDGGIIYIPIWYSLNVQEKYFDEYEESKDPRKAFCALVLSMVEDNASQTNQSIENININDIYGIDDKYLIDILELIVMQSDDLTQYYKKNSTDNYFEDFYNSISYERDKYIKVNKEFIARITKHLSEASKKSKIIHNEFLKFGWYFQNFDRYRIKDIYNVINSDLKNNKEEYIKVIDNFMNKQGEEDSEKIINSIVNMFPKRSRIILDAYNAHNQKLYTLSIPAMLTQIDGISNDILGKSFYSKVRGKDEPLTKQGLEKLFKENNIDINKEGLDYAINYYPLEVLQSLIVKIDDINIKYKNNEIYSTFNRHKVIHGFDTEYNKTNSNKCIAILGYLYNLKKVLEDDIKQCNYIDIL